MGRGFRLATASNTVFHRLPNVRSLAQKVAKLNEFGSLIRTQASKSDLVVIKG